VGSLRTARHFDREAYVRQLAEQGFTHLTVNGLAVDRPFETGPPGDVYSWFYDYSPDLDQFVSSSLLDDTYPADYRSTNLAFLKSNASLALRHGLIPGLHINSPRSMPEKFWQRYPYLRGARIDHPRESFLPRYTLAMAHPVVQQHYRELVRNILREVPELGFIHVWTNDSGSGFEFVTSLYAGRNGGPYLIREWKGDDEIARKAAENILTYYRLLRDEARNVNPEFRVICDLGSFYAERKYIAPSLGKGLDAGAFGSFEGSESAEERAMLQKTGARVHNKLDLGSTNVLGIPYPYLLCEQLRTAVQSGVTHLLTNATPRSLAPYDINNKVLQAFQQSADINLETLLGEVANRLVGATHVSDLVDVWKLSDIAVRSYPNDIPYGTFAFPWFRLWIRPFVPNIDAIPEADRAYYERYLLATFNNPARVDLNNDMLWNFLTVEGACKKKEIIDHEVLPAIDQALTKTGKWLQKSGSTAVETSVFRDLNDRLRAARCFYVTMRNTVAWTESVHGFMAATGTERPRFRLFCRAMVQSELENARSLLKLWNESTVDWMPVSGTTESLHIYDEHFGDHLCRKIALMEQHIDDEPYIDPNFMWRMPEKSLEFRV
jgi:hypothetical protein